MLNRKNYYKLYGNQSKLKSVTKMSEAELRHQIECNRGSHRILNPESNLAKNTQVYLAELSRRGLPVTGNNTGTDTYGSKTQKK